MEQQYSSRSPAVKRLMQEAKELHEPTEMYHAHPVEDNLFEWHFTVRGAPDTSFAGGIYHGRITLPAEYPMKPPSIMLYTVCLFYLYFLLTLQPNGRFAINTKICLSISGYHPESWQPSWSSGCNFFVSCKTCF
jgi:ubiquitin-conjugating enzyme E2 J1